MEVFYQQKVQVKFEFGPGPMIFDRFTLELGMENIKYGI
jgi:hypothetical protein